MPSPTAFARSHAALCHAGITTGLVIVVAIACADRRSSGEALRPPATLQGAPLDVSHNAYGHAMANLAGEHWHDLRDGKALFITTWVAAGEAAAERALRGSSSQVREGLGPRFNENSCQSCHFRDGRGRPIRTLGRALGRARGARDREGSGPPRLLRLGRTGPEGELVPEPAYGMQLQDRALSPLAPEGAFDVGARTIEGRYPDGTRFALAAPEITLRALSRGPIDPSTRISLRIPPSLIGLGLLEAIPEAAIVALADPDDADRDGISGRPNRVRDPQTGAIVLGRFGWKASQPSLWLQNATALREDLGVTTPVFPEPACATDDTACAAASTSPAPELDGEDLERLTRYTRLLGPPEPRGAGDAEIAQGEAVFTRTGCAACHKRRFKTGEVSDLPELARQVIEPYSDLLLHDMGEALSDRRPDGDASGQEWRTAPLWGLGLLRAVSGEVRLLHDGRARSPEEAILWHGGEAQAARDRFAGCSRKDRTALLRFLDAL
jgi:CxxC motif-containing protein (DUF1111 family)